MFRQVLVLILAVSFILSACSTDKGQSGSSLEQLKKKGEIIVATTGTYPPYSYHDADGLTGFDIDISKEIGRRIGLKVKFAEVEFAGMFSGLDGGRFDTIPQLSITEERKKKYDFSDPYQFSNLTLIVLEENQEMNSFEDLKGKKTNGLAESVQGALALQYGATLVPENGDSVELLTSKRVDALIYNSLYFLDLRKKRPDLKIKIVDQSDDIETAAYLFRKGNEDTIQAFNEALKAMHEDGTYAQISTKYFGKDISEGMLDY
ncbi:transporter substrate-binding domain-containing protein [Paenibacillus xylaniclasticus]|uniref:transporter substrate-binding domain-containing protein n=1 Tax=Paenibacillus xylaniclasticus TaxID=588083 RepID=UPI0013DFBC3E|nr:MULTISPECIES: transporter substrate-binding domain-containing protein [Paenibacillus]